jgi:hypothetical protein
VLRWVQSFLRTSFARRVAAAGAGKAHRELPFLLRLDGSRCKMHLKGQIDLLFEDENGGAVVIDYKTGERHSRGLAGYAFQLDCYALAAQQLVKDGVSVRTGVAFLHHHSAEPELRPPLSGEELRAIESRLTAAARNLMETIARGGWEGLPSDRCAEIGCGYQYRCHAERAAL